MVSRVSALNHMVRNGYTREEIEKVRQGLKTFGWRTDPSLPPGFLTRCVELYPESGSKLKLNDFVLALNFSRFSGKERQVQFLTPDNERLDGRSVLDKFLKRCK